MYRFVILLHDHPTPHWDFFLEAGGGLRSWRLAEYPVAGHSVDATPLPEHRRHYLDYEGPVSGDRGSVSRVAARTYDTLRETATLLEVSLHFTEGQQGTLVDLIGRFEQGDLNSAADCVWTFFSDESDSSRRH